MVQSHLRIAAELKNLKGIRRFIRETGTALGADGSVISDLVRAVDEAATNIIFHGYRLEGGMIEVEVERAGGDLVVRLRDTAEPFDPTCAPTPDLSLPLEERAPGGLGIYMMREVVDQVLHCVTPQGGNELTLIKTLAAGKGEDNGDHRNSNAG
jgi:anti-sigma regulatory factor (Ser/Thr protein kinase)